MESISPGRALAPSLVSASTEDPDVLFIADDECSDLAEHYRLKLTLDGYRVTVITADRLTAQHVRELNPDLIVLEVQRLTPRSLAVWTKLRWARGAKSTPLLVLSPKPQEALTKIGIKLDWCDHFVDWSRSAGLSPHPPGLRG